MTDERLKDFRNFLYVIWQHHGLPDPSEVQYEIAEFLQYGPSRRIINAFRAVGKSWITAAYVLWRLYLDPQLNIEVISATQDEANNFSNFCFRMINEIEFLRVLRPDVSKGQRNSLRTFDVGPALTDKEPSVKSVGINGQITGSRADIIIADDIEISTNCDTQSARDKLSARVSEFTQILKPEGGDIIYLGTPHTEDSLYLRLESKTGFTRRVWPILVPTEKEFDFYANNISPYIHGMYNQGLHGDSVWPTRFDDESILTYKGEGATKFQMQQMLNPVLTDLDRYPLKLADLIVMDTNAETAPENLIWASDPDLAWGNDVPNVGFTGDRLYKPMKTMGDWVKYEGIVMAIDPAGRGEDETGYAIVANLYGILHVLDFGGFDDGYSEATLKALAALAAEYKVNSIIIEANFGDGMYSQMFKPILYGVHKCHVEEVKHSVQKEKRICDTLEPIMNRHKLVINKDAIIRDRRSALSKTKISEVKRGRYQLTHQLTRITRDKGSLTHDDRLDALSMAVGHWTSLLAQNAEDRILERSRGPVDDFILGIGDYGQDTEDPSWFNNI